MILGNNPVLVAIRTVFLAGFTSLFSRDRVGEREAREGAGGEAGVPGRALLVSLFLHIPWSQVLSAGLASTDGAGHPPSCVPE